jgi:hypothetical protein
MSDTSLRHCEKCRPDEDTCTCFPAVPRLSDSVLAAEVKRMCTLKELSQEQATYIDALGTECMRRLNKRGVWLGPGFAIKDGTFYNGPQV